MAGSALTVIVPVYNVDGYLTACLESLLNARPRAGRYEIVCVDDGSTDGSASILDLFSSRAPEIRVLRQANRGYGAAVNAGLGEATGTYVTIVDADDTVRPNAYADLITLMENTPWVDFVKTPFLKWGEGLPQKSIAVPPGKRSASDILAKSRQLGLGRRPQGRVFTHDRLCFEPPAIWSAVYRRQSLLDRDIRLVETPGAGYQDAGFAAQCFLSSMRYLWVNDPYYLYRIDRPDASRNVRTRCVEIFDVFDFVRAYLEKQNYMTHTVEKYYFAIFFMRFVWFCERVKHGRKDAVMARALDAFERAISVDSTFRGVMRLLPKDQRHLFSLLRAGHCEPFDKLFG